MTRIDRIPVTICDREWTIKVIHAKPARGIKHEGLCDLDGRIITLYTRGTRRTARWILLHELLHAVCGYMDEDEVDRVARELDVALSVVTLGKR